MGFRNFGAACSTLQSSCLASRWKVGMSIFLFFPAPPKHPTLNIFVFSRRRIILSTTRRWRSCARCCRRSRSGCRYRSRMSLRGVEHDARSKMWINPSKCTYPSIRSNPWAGKHLGLLLRDFNKCGCFHTAQERENSRSAASAWQERRCAVCYLKCVNGVKISGRL